MAPQPPEQRSRHVVSYLAPEVATKSPDRASVDTQKNEPGPRGPGSAGALANAVGKRSGNGPDPGAHQADTVEIGLFPGALFSPLARLVALVEQFDFLELIEGFS